MDHETYVFRNEDDESRLEKLKKALFPVALIVAAAAIAALCLLLFSRCEKPALKEVDESPNFALYLKTGELNFTDTEMTLRLSSALKTMADQNNYSFENYAINSIGGFTHVSKNGKRIFFGDRIGGVDGGMCLYYVDTDTKDAVPVLIAKGVTEYTVSEEADRVVYLDGSLRLYVYDFKENKLICEDVSEYITSPDGKRVFLRDGKANLYSYRQGGKLTLMTDTLVSRINGADKELNTVYYTDMYNSVLRQKQDGLPVTVFHGEEMSVLQTYMYCFSGGDAYFVCNKTGSAGTNEIWYMSVDGSAKRLLPENAGTITCLSSAKETAAAFFEVRRSDGSMTEYYVATGENLTKVYEGPYSENHIKAEMNKEGTKLYFSDIYYAKTYFVKIEGNNVSKSMFLGETLDNELRGFYGDGLFAVYSWQQTEGGVSEKGVTLFKDGEAVTRLRDTYKVVYCDKTDAFYFNAGYNDKTAKGSLMMYKDGETRELEKDVFDFTVTQKGDILFIKEYDTGTKQGNLYLYSEDGAVFLDRGVTAFAFVTDSTKKIWG